MYKSTHTHNTCCQRPKGRVLSRAGLLVTDKRLIHLITFNESAVINRHRLTLWHFTEANMVTCWYLGCTRNKEAMVWIQIICTYMDMFMCVNYRIHSLKLSKEHRLLVAHFQQQPRKSSVAQISFLFVLFPKCGVICKYNIAQTEYLK